MQLGVVSLWSLLEACRAGSEEEQREAAATAAMVVQDHVGERSLTLELRDSVLVIDDFPAVSGVDTFAATHGLLGFLRDAGVQWVRFARDVDADALRAWAAHVVVGDAPTAWPAGVEVRLRCEPTSTDLVRPQAPRAAIDVPDSRLRSVFLQHRLIAGLPRIAGVDAATAKLVIQGVVDRLLQVEGGLEPLMLLQEDESVLQRSTAVAVLTVVIARCAGWPLEQLADVGAAGLLHDLGSVLDERAPGTAAFRWLLDCGDDDFWLRSALCARRWRDGEQAMADPAGPLAIIAIVRLAVAAHGGGAAAIDAVGERGDVPPALVAIARQAIAA
ncbi:MAG: hypothetical protein ACE37K_23375 [Planctomycetota bacterium]